MIQSNLASASYGSGQWCVRERVRSRRAERRCRCRQLSWHAPPRCMLMLVVRACSLSAASCVHMHVEYRAVARAVVWRVELTLDAREL